MNPSETFERLILANGDKWTTPDGQTIPGHLKDGGIRFSISSTVTPGNVLTRQRDNSKWLITDQQQTAAYLQCPALRCDQSAAIMRRSSVKNSFGRSAEQLDIVAVDLPIATSSHKFLPPPTREGGNSPVEYNLQTSAAFDIRQGDTIQAGADTMQVTACRQVSPGVLSILAIG